MYLLGAATTLVTLIILFFYKEELDVKSLIEKGLIKTNLDSSEKESSNQSYYERYTREASGKNKIW